MQRFFHSFKKADLQPQDLKCCSELPMVAGSYITAILLNKMVVTSYMFSVTSGSSEHTAAEIVSEEECPIL